jgi:hypothetical protein
MCPSRQANASLANAVRRRLDRCRAATTDYRQTPAAVFQFDGVPPEPGNCFAATSIVWTIASLKRRSLTFESAINARRNSLSEADQRYATAAVLIAQRPSQLDHVHLLEQNALSPAILSNPSGGDHSSFCGERDRGLDHLAQNQDFGVISTLGGAITGISIILFPAIPRRSPTIPEVDSSRLAI